GADNAPRPQQQRREERAPATADTQKPQADTTTPKPIAAPAPIAPAAIVPAPLAATPAMLDTSRPTAEDASEDAELQSDAADGIESGDDGSQEAGGRRRRGRRGGRRRRRGNATDAAIGGETIAEDALGLDEPQATLDRSQPEFDFDDLPAIAQTSAPVAPRYDAQTAETRAIETPAPVASTSETATSEQPVAIETPAHAAPAIEAAPLEAPVATQSIPTPSAIVERIAAAEEAPVFVEAPPVEVPTAEATMRIDAVADAAVVEAAPVVESEPVAASVAEAVAPEPQIATFAATPAEPVVEPAAVEHAAVASAAIEPTAVEPAVVAGDEAPSVEAEPAVVVAQPDVAPELAREIAAPQYGIGLQLFDALPDTTAQPTAQTADADHRDDAPKNA
ncbi:MAG: hypothetical protein ACOY82_00005, partial [Pseudomonadota bacterium]